MVLPLTWETPDGLMDGWSDLLERAINEAPA